MRQNFTTQLIADGQSYITIMLPHLRHNGMHYEVNIKGYPRFMMKMSELGRYDIITPSSKVPYSLILAASDAIEAYERQL